MEPKPNFPNINPLCRANPISFLLTRKFVSNYSREKEKKIILFLQPVQVNLLLWNKENIFLTKPKEGLVRSEKSPMGQSWPILHAIV
jgi:hypothetical protein